MLTRTDLFQNDFLNVRHVFCRHAPRNMGDAESSNADTLIFPLRGLFIPHFSRRNHVVADPSKVLVFPTGRSCKVSHPIVQHDESLVLEFSRSCFEEAVSESGCRNIATHLPLSPSWMAWRHLLWRRLEQRTVESLEVEEVCISMLASVLRQMCTGQPTANDRPRSGSVFQQMEAVRIAMLMNPEKNWTLTLLAQTVQSSPFHIARMFRKRTGIPVHRFLTISRLSRSIDLLLDTQKDLTGLAMDLGFSSHSHFTAAFRQKIGITPSEFRNAASRKISGSRNLLTALLST